MKLKKFLIILFVFLLIASIVGWFYYKNSTNSIGEGESDSDNFFNNLFPFGNNNTDQDNTTINNGAGEIGGLENINLDENFVFGQLTKDPVSGALFVKKDSSNYLRYMSRTSGNIFDINLLSGSSERITNTTALEIYNVLFFNDGNSFISQKLNTEGESVSYTNSISTTTGSFKSDSFLARNINSLSILNNTKNVLFVYGDGGGGVFTLNNGSDDKIVYKSPFAEWNIYWINPKNILIYPKPSSGVVGALYTLDIESGKTKRVLAATKGLSATMSPDEKFVLFSSMVDSSIKTYIFNTITKSTNQLNISTFLEKCVWKTDSVLVCAVPNSLPKNTKFPDDWYKGYVSFNDDIYEVDAETSFATNITSIFDSEEYLFDLTDPKIEKIEDGYLLYFINKKDLTLWGLRLDN
ncbi:hypothetical protein COW81_00230 [Candidatus Campbellbacteria bacterium CG22_combo_CG10-13_8_21_14_all_36_13]|uniref:Dipeptidylpeptidase IV N-terminal domain-containing protein n=1 Tax=Candidatus Campbellbacteria bacterium CG22_combo_CG10-13_8_21_14_all_36_13 TaxID=1974529 RepID=A0A2H0DZ44_9BACT|nr:MAG: hypothetical protein COW81_00230 [Candidatus Campbellbacteria bacterium CG22_combo_CG10-13_8_21_14_all_36_13]